MGPDQFLAPATEIVAETGPMKHIRGVDLKDWRKRHRYNQAALMMELGVNSRQTMSTWEKSSNELPRIIQLALWALEEIPEARYVDGKRPRTADKRRWKKQRS